jgi:hypothetical protein
VKKPVVGLLLLIAVAAAGVIWQWRQVSGWKARQVATAPDTAAQPTVVESSAVGARVVAPVFSIRIGDDYKKVVAMYGQGKDEDGGYRRWERKDMSLLVILDTKSRVIDLRVAVAPGHVICTPDGVCLGRDTYADVRRIGAAQKLKLRDETVSGVGTDILLEHFPAARLGPDEDGSYSWSTDDANLPVIPDLTKGDHKEKLERQMADYFRDKPVMSYEDELEHPAARVPFKNDDAGG